MREGDWQALAVGAAALVVVYLACWAVSFVVVYLVCWAVS